ncbi:hypothetical protein [Sphingomonas sp.]|uniref:hypothetical protein n=1 Tax=Sphingomonas sp. TaxID=28214 RepID=UPI000DB42694|nr:hypothetical protein [Sphingomonas sp.]PZU09810.1 MAG: hypothetical protein DI605_09280 [Sphingomonas sp.]
MLDRSKGFAIRNRFLAIVAGAIACALPATCAHADPTPAGTRIANTASLSFVDGNSSVRISSNTVTLGVDMLLDVAIRAEQPTVRPAANGPTPIAFVITNSGNAEETFTLSGAVDPNLATLSGLAIDSDDNGVYGDGDTLLTGSSVKIAPGEHRRLFALVRLAGSQDAALSITVASSTGSGDAGTVFAGAGAGGVDAIVGRTGARATASVVLGERSTGPTLEKSQTVLARDGSAHAGHGSIITYRLDARFPGAATAVELRDPIPAGTAFVAGSITLDGQSLTDAADGDMASFDGSAVHILFGDVTTAATRTVTFQAKIL